MNNSVELYRKDKIPALLKPKDKLINIHKSMWFGDVVIVCAIDVVLDKKVYYIGKAVMNISREKSEEMVVKHGTEITQKQLIEFFKNG